jgi:hypothetical protein
MIPEHHGSHAQTALRTAISQNGNDWDRDNRKRNELITELHDLDQKIAGYEQRHREYSKALALVEHFMPTLHATTRQAPNTPEEFEQTLTPTRTPEKYDIQLTPKEAAP